MPDCEIIKIVVDIQPIGRRIEVQEGTNLLMATQAAGIGVVSLCGGEGWCKRCLVKVVSGDLNPPTQIEIEYLGENNLSAGYRFACQAVPQSDTRIDISPDSLSTLQCLRGEDQGNDLPVNPIVDLVDLELYPPDFNDLRADAQRLKDALADAGCFSNLKLSVLSSISSNLRLNNWQIRLVIRKAVRCRDEVIAILPPESKIYGIAIDLGTTKLAIYLVDLQTGKIIDKTGAMNPQIAYGEDVISRISYANRHIDGCQQLQRVLVDVLNAKILELCRNNDVTSLNIVDGVLVGNTAMHHLLAGLPVAQLVFEPYVPAVNEAMDFKAKEIGLALSPGAYIHLLPNIAGYVGADHSAVILSTELWKTGKNVLAIDIGTITEITLAAKGRLLSCSCTSGLALEGAHVRDGMQVAPGAIERGQIVDEEIRVFTINNELPVGICGSGILDVVAEIRSPKLIDDKGIFVDDHLNIFKSKKNLEFLLVPAVSTGHGRDIVVSRKDVNEIQQAKAAAIRAGQEILFDRAGIAAEEIDEILIAGAFGTYIDVPNAISIGMFPDIPLQHIHQIGNAAGMGAVKALISVDYRQLIADVVKDVDYIELTNIENFPNMLM